MSLSRRAFIGGLIGTAAGGIVLGNSCYHHFQKRNTQSLEKVLLIGVDGLRPDALLQAATPHLDALISDGAYSFEARTGTHTITGPGWSNVLTGVWEDKHGVKSNGIKDNTFDGANYQKYPTFLTRIEDHKPSLHTSIIASLDWITKSITSKADAKIYHPFDDEGDRRVAEAAAYLLEHRNMDFMFAYFLGVDIAGHNYGFDPNLPEYLSEIETVDHYVGMLMGALKKRPAYSEERWLTIFTSDHGGKGKHHDGVGEEAQKVPLIMHGPAVEKGEILPVPTQVDIAPTILHHFGVPIDPQWGLDGKVVGLKQSYIRVESP